MNKADQLVTEFQQLHPELLTTPMSLEEVNILFGEFVKIKNSQVREDFEGLSAAQMHDLITNPFASHSLISLKQDLDSAVEDSPIFQLSEMLLKEVVAVEKLKLTQKGNLPVSICKKLVQSGFIFDPYDNDRKKFTEDEISYIWPLKEYFLSTGILKKRGQYLSTTKKAEKFISLSSPEKFLKLFRFFLEDFHWANFYEGQDIGRYGREGIAYSMLLLSKYGNSFQEDSFYSSKLVKVFGSDAWSILPDDPSMRQHITDYHTAYAIRLFEYFLPWFGLVEKKERKLLEPSEYKKTALFNKIFVFEHF